MTPDQPLQLAATDHNLLFSHAVLWGAGSIAAAAGHREVRLGWTGHMSRVPSLYGVAVTDLALAVRQRAADALNAEHWIQAGLPHEPARALFSPRIKALEAPEVWAPFQSARHDHVDRLGVSGSPLDLRLLAALGEPSSWHSDRGKPKQDHAATRLEMQPRNNGSEFVGTRLRSLATAVAARTVADVAAGLTGAIRVDEVGKGDKVSYAGANLMPPQATDNALAWAAMWGLSCAPVVHRVHQPSRTATHLPRPRDGALGDEVRAGHVVVPIWSGRWTVARLTSVLASGQLAESGGASLGSGAPAAGAEQWLRERGVVALVTVPIHTFGSTSSPERRAMAGKSVTLGLSAS